MMQVRVVWMTVDEPGVSMAMCMRLFAVPRLMVLVLVVLVVHVNMVVLERLMRMPMLVALAHVQPNAEGHEHRGSPEKQAGLLTQQH
jgi:hypothetical protein